MNRFLKLPTASIGLMALLTTCQPDFDAIQLRTLDRSVWPQNQKLEYILDWPKPAIPFDLLYQVQLAPSYSYQNIWLKYWIIGPNGDTLTSSKDNLNLFESSGKPVGVGNQNRLFVDAYFLKNIRLTQPGKHRLVVQHYMREDSLRGIQSLGIRLQESESE